MVDWSEIDSEVRWLSNSEVKVLDVSICNSYGYDCEVNITVDSKYGESGVDEFLRKVQNKLHNLGVSADINVYY